MLDLIKTVRQIVPIPFTLMTQCSFFKTWKAQLRLALFFMSNQKCHHQYYLHPMPHPRQKLQKIPFLNIIDLLKLKFSRLLRSVPGATLAIGMVIGKEILRARRRSREEMTIVAVSHSNRNPSIWSMNKNLRRVFSCPHRACPVRSQSNSWHRRTAFYRGNFSSSEARKRIRRAISTRSTHRSSQTNFLGSYGVVSTSNLRDLEHSSSRHSW